ncbi:MAG: hypothetical protein J6J51_04630 [Clostridia bacterium]|nr:hypothetical protein [Clostridia bacterium]
MRKTKVYEDHTGHLLRWIKNHGGWWYLICTPGDERMTFELMRIMIQKLYKEKLYELIFVLLMVHRQAPFMEHVMDNLLLDGLVKRWGKDKDDIVKELIQLLT